MKTIALRNLLCFVVFICVIACNKGNPDQAGQNRDQNPEIGSVEDSTKQNTDQQQEITSFEDSTAVLVAKWKLIKDSSTNTDNYWNTAGGVIGSPGVGVYYGKDVDYYDFRADGTWYIYANGDLFKSTYKLYPNNKLVITAMLAYYDTATMIRLTRTEAVMDWRATSPNGGKYFRRSYLER